MKFLQVSLLFRAINHKMSTTSSQALMPIGVRGMTILNREKFVRDVTVPVLKISEDNLAKVIKLCKPYLLKLENFKPIQSCTADFGTDKPNKYIHLSPEKVSSWTDITELDRQQFEKKGVNSSNFETRNVQLRYENWRSEQIFKSVLPEGEEIVSGFSQIGHIVHLNLRDHLLSYRPLIGQVLVDKIKTCRTVVNKCNVIDNTYRNFSMEVIAGDEDYLVTVKENRCIFQFDFSKVYWNPRLGKEHERILGLLKPGDVLFDVFCGVGPFAVPAAKRKCRVFANDLNPDSYKWLNHNAKSNKIDMNIFKSYNLDGKDFIVSVFKDYLIKYCNGTEKLQDGSQIHVTMNLPAMAIDFLQYFRGLIKDQQLLERLDCKITVYVYCFAVGEDMESIKSKAKEMVIRSIGCDVSEDITDVFDVRNVSPKKEMMRVTLNLTKKVIFSESKCGRETEPPVKKACLNKE